LVVSTEQNIILTFILIFTSIAYFHIRRFVSVQAARKIKEWHCRNPYDFSLWRPIVMTRLSYNCVRRHFVSVYGYTSISRSKTTYQNISIGEGLLKLRTEYVDNCVCNSIHRSRTRTSALRYAVIWSLADWWSVHWIVSACTMSGICNAIVLWNVISSVNKYGRLCITIEVWRNYCDPIVAPIVLHFRQI
jgi:hypothetical protein